MHHAGGEAEAGVRSPHVGQSVGTEGKQSKLLESEAADMLTV